VIPLLPAASPTRGPGTTHAPRDRLQTITNIDFVGVDQNKCRIFPCQGWNFVFQIMHKQSKIVFVVSPEFFLNFILMASGVVPPE